MDKVAKIKFSFLPAHDNQTMKTIIKLFLGIFLAPILFISFSVSRSISTLNAQSCPTGGLAECGIIGRNSAGDLVCNPSGAYYTTCYVAGGQCKMSTDKCHGIGQCVGTDPCSGTGGGGGGGGCVCGSYKITDCAKAGSA